MKKKIVAFSLAVLMMFACVDSSAFAVGSVPNETNEAETVVIEDQEEVINNEELNDNEGTAVVEENTTVVEPNENQVLEGSDEPTIDEAEEAEVVDSEEEPVKANQDKENTTDAKANVMSVTQNLETNSLQTEIDAAVSGQQTTVSITGGTVLNTSVTIRAQKNIVLNLNSYQVESSDATPLIIVEENATLTIQGTGSMLNSFENGVVIENNGTLFLTGGTLNASGTGGMVVSKTVNSQKEKGTYTISTGSVVSIQTVTPVNSLKVIVLKAPTKLKSSNVNYRTIKLTWTKAEGAKAYEVYRSTSEISGFTKVWTTPNAYYTDKKLTTGTKYYYKVKSVFDTTASEFSSTIYRTPKPGAADNVKAVSTNYSSTKITWSKVSGATSYRIYRSTQEKTGYSRIATVTDGTEYADKDLKNGTTYYYKVRAFAKKVTGIYSKSVSVKPVIKKPTKVTAKSAAYNAVEVKWKKVSGASKYAIYQSTNKSSGYKKIATVSSKTIKYKATKLKAGTEYFYKIYAVKSGVQGKASSAAYATPKPKNVTSINVTSGGSKKATLTWSKAKGAQKYRIYRSTKKTSGYKRIATVSSLIYTDSDLVNGTTYFYKIVSTSGKAKSGYSSAATFTNASKIKLSKTSLSLQVGKTKTLKTTITPSSTTTKTVKWSSSNTNVAKVSQKGKVRTIAAGTAIITAKTANGRTAKCTVTVTKGIVVVLDPGHGGSDPGAVYNGVYEKTLNLKVSKYTKEELETYDGVEVYLTRSTDVFIPLGERSQFAKDKGATCLVAQHFNASGSHTATGAGVFVTVQSSYSDESKGLANKVISALKSDIGIGEWGVFTRASTSYPGKDYYSVIRGSVEKGFPGVIVENGFMDSSDYSKYLNSNSKLKKIGVSNAQAIAAYYGLSKK